MTQAVQKILRTRFHRPFSRSRLVLAYRQRTSGDRRTVAVRYAPTDDGPVLRASMNDEWVREIGPIAPVSVVIEGHERSGIAMRLEQPGDRARAASAYATRFSSLGARLRGGNSASAAADRHAYYRLDTPPVAVDDRGGSRSRVTVKVVAALAVAGLVIGAATGLATGAGARPCSDAGFFENGTQLGDGIFLAAVRRGCADDGRKTCTVADGTGPITSETVDRGIGQDCVAFNQFIGAGLNQIAYYVTGECFGKAIVASEGVFSKRTVYSKFRCKP